MIAKAVGRYIRVSPRKIRTAIALIRGKYVDEALAILNTTNRRATFFLVKLLNSAVANARRLPNIRQEDLYISDIFADGGPMLKRYKAQALGRATMIRRRTSHITVELETRQLGSVKADKKARRLKNRVAVAERQIAARPKKEKAAGAKTAER